MGTNVHVLSLIYGKSVPASKREKIFCEDTNKLEHPNKIVVLLLDIEYPSYN